MNNIRLCVLTQRSLNGAAPVFPAENIRLTADVERRRHLRCSTTTTLVVSPVQRSIIGDRAFPVAARRHNVNVLLSNTTFLIFAVLVV